MSLSLKTKINVSSILGATFTWYDFLIFNIAIAIIFPKIFFPGMGPLLPIFAFAVGFLARPLGSMIFGFIGDKFGRKFSMISTLLVTGISTVSIGLLPTYQDIGVLATILLVIARIAQTAAVGGEYGAASTLLVEHNLESKKKSFISSFVTSGFAVGSILASLAFFAVVSLGDEFFVEVGWRIPFLLSAVLLVIGVYMRSGITETPSFVETQKNNKIVSNPLKTVITQHYRTMILSALAVSLPTSWTNAIMVFGAGYMIQSGLISRPEFLEVQILAWCVIAVAMATGGWLGDKIDKYKVFLACSVFSVILTWPIFMFISQGDALWAMLCLVLVMAPAIGTVPLLFCQLFPTEIRQTGSGVSYNLGLVFSGIMTIASQQILSNTQDIMDVAYAYMALTLVALISALYLRKQTVAAIPKT